MSFDLYVMEKIVIILCFEFIEDMLRHDAHSDSVALCGGAQ